MKEQEFLTNLNLFQNTSNRLVQKVVKAAIERYDSGKPALNQQDVVEQLEHLQGHLNNVIKNDKGDEESVTEQLLHLCCRSLLTLYAWQQQHKLTTDMLFDENSNRP